MTPELSRRVARAIHRLPDGRLTMNQRAQLADEAQRANTFEQLPGWIQQLVREGEGTS